MNTVSLTAKECEIATLMAQGLTTKAIARRLNGNPKTINTHRSRILQKYNVHTTGAFIGLYYGIREEQTP
jgi:DNA-binding CsgD family transcriptional regulator